jgi:hypothetical protein
VTHDEAAPLLPELLRGGLHDDVRADLAAHFAGCDECRSLSVAYDAIAAALRHDPGGASWAHPASRDIVAYAIAHDTLEPPDAGRVEAHVRECGPCHGEVETTRRVHAATGAAEAVPFDLARRAGRPGPNARAALAAAAVLLVLSYPAYLGLRRLPAARSEAAALRAEKESAEQQLAGLESARERAIAELRQAREWSGAVDLHVLEGTARGAGRINETIAVAPGQPFVLFAVVPPQTPATAPPAEVYRFSIDRPQEGAVWSQDLTAAQVREQVRSSGVVTFALPASMYFANTSVGCSMLRILAPCSKLPSGVTP